MTFLRRVVAAVRDLFRGARVRRELDAELHEFFEASIEHKMHAGLSRAAATRAARRELGSVEAVKDRTRDVGWESSLENLWRDVRYAARTLRKSPGFTAVAVVILSLAIGANTAVFTLVDSVVLAALPVERPQELAIVDVITQRGERQNVSYPMFERIRDDSHAFAGAFAALDGVNTMDADVGGRSGAPEKVRVNLVSGEYFDVLGVRAAAGRTLAADDNRIGGDSAVAVISHEYWTRRFAANPAAIGTTVRIKRQLVTIVGVTSPAFFGEAVGRAPDMWMPLRMQPIFDRGMSLLDRPNTGWLRVIGRLRQGESSATAEAALAVMLKQVQSDTTGLGQYAQRISLRTADGSRGLPDFRERYLRPLRILAGTVAIILLIACANLATLLLARATARQREISVRLAIGAGRRRIIRQLLTESAVLGTVAGLLGSPFAWWGSRLLLSLASPDGVPIPIDVTLNGRSLLFMCAVSIGTVVLFGLIPALATSRVEGSGALRPAAGTPARSRLSQALLVVQVALSLALLMAAALFAQTLDNLRHRDLGFAAGSLVEIRIAPEASGYRQEQLPDLSRRLVERFNAIPGVRSASVTQKGFGSRVSTTCCVAVQGYRHDADEDRLVATMGVDAGYLETMGLSLSRGRRFAARDVKDDPRAVSVAIVNQAFVRRYLDGRDPVGARFGWGDPPKVSYSMEIIGVVNDAVYADLRERSKPLIYFPSSWGSTFIVRTVGVPEALMPALLRGVSSVDADLGVNIRTVNEVVNRAVVRERLLATLSSFFASLAAVLAGVGLYGLMAYGVVRRTREIGIRMALGAARASVLRSEIGAAVRLVAIGIGAGVPVAYGAGVLIKSQLFGVSGTDPIAFAGAAVLLVAVAAAAAYLPARRASHVDPIVALRCE